MQKVTENICIGEREGMRCGAAVILSHGFPGFMI